MNLDQVLNDIELADSKSSSDITTRSPVATKRSDNGFHDLDIAPNLLKAVDRLKFENPTPIQKVAIPAGIKGDDIIAMAQTGSGKTLAFGIPMLQRLSKMNRGVGLVLVPTRELAIQVDESLQPISRTLNMRSAVLIGGASMTIQWNALKRNPRIIIATPGRLMDHIDRKILSLSNVEVFVLDEADRMLDMGFAPDIKKIMKSIPDRRQTMLFSATMPKVIEAIARKLMENPTRIEIDRSGATPAEVSQEMFFIKNQDRSRLLAFQLKQRTGPVLVFTRTKRMASKLTAKINNMGFNAAEIHSNRSLGQRRQALDGFKRGRYQILIATDIAARGIDVSGIELVVNYDMPANSEDYVHRIGRTGRAGKSGHAISFATADQKGSIRNIERFMKTKLAISSLPILPSEKLLIKEADQLNLKKESPGDEQTSRRKFSKARSSKRKVFKNGGSKKTSTKRFESKQNESRGKDSNRTESKRRFSISRNAQSTDSNQKESTKESSFWSKFKKSKPGKKKSMGQAAWRKKRTKSKSNLK